MENSNDNNDSGCIIILDLISSIVMLVWLLTQDHIQTAIWILVFIPFNLWLISKIVK